MQSFGSLPKVRISKGKRDRIRSLTLPCFLTCLYNLITGSLFVLEMEVFEQIYLFHERS
jgi:hypothetical protein